MRNRKKMRMDNWDYSSPSEYFVTICTKGRINYFGEIFDGKMKLNVVGQIADDFWRRIPKHFENAEIDEYVIMPNHVHGIVRIVDDAFVGSADLRSLQMHPLRNVNVIDDRTKMLLPKIIHGYKSSVTREVCRKFGEYDFGWQNSYYDHIVRDQDDYQRIREYIKDNPRNWSIDAHI